MTKRRFLMATQRTSSLIVIKRLAQLSLICLTLFFLVKTVLIASRAQSPDEPAQERKLKLKEFKDAPIVIHKVKNLHSNSWHKDLEIEIKNVSDKPIYFMLAYLIFPDQPVPADGRAGVRLVYGDPKKNGLIDNYANPEDEHIAPGETYVFTIPEIDRKGIAVRDKKFPERNKNLVLEFQIINFGDGTGFEGARKLDLRRRSYTPPLGEQIFKKISLTTSTKRTAAQDSCGSCSRWLIMPEPVNTSCSCRPTQLATTSPSRPCGRITLSFFDCDGDGNYECHDDVLDIDGSASCPGATTTPTPTPTPSPSAGPCDPDTKNQPTLHLPDTRPVPDGHN
jgi:hypothetical protein